MKFSQLAVGNFQYAQHTFEYFLDSMDRLGIAKLELWAAAPHCYFPDINYMQMKEFATRLKRRRFQICCVTPEQYLYPINIAASNTDERKRSINYFKRAIDAASELEAPKVLVASGHYAYEESYQEAWQRCCDSLTELSHNACFKGVEIVFEPMMRKNDIVCSASDAKKMLDAVQFYPGIKSMVDIDISYRFGELPSDFAKLFGVENLHHVHLNDGLPGGHLALGDGNIPMDLIFSDLDSIQYTGDVSLEIENTRYDADPETAIRKSVDMFKQHCSQ